jgi:hypothetical protein
MCRVPKSFLLVCLCLVLVEGTLSAQKGPKLAKLAELVVPNSETAYVHGVWRPDNPARPIVEAVTDFSCFHSGGNRLLATDPFCIRATATITDSSTGLLDVRTKLLQITEWNATRIVATDDSGCVNSEIIFDLNRKTVSAINTKKAEAHEIDVCGSVPERQTYYLQDVLDYYGHK